METFFFEDGPGILFLLCDSVCDLWPIFYIFFFFLVYNHLLFTMIATMTTTTTSRTATTNVVWYTIVICVPELYYMGVNISW